CFRCGDISLGGWVTYVDEDGAQYLGGNPAREQRSIPLSRRRHEEYRWLRPGEHGEVPAPQVVGDLELHLVQRHLDRRLGSVTTEADAGTTPVLALSPLEKGTNRAADAVALALPPVCPLCLWEDRNNPTKYRSGYVRSPIRGHAAGAE